jgi:UDP-glucose 4-epimerase
MKKNGKILVSGGRGFVGKNVCRYLTKRGNEVIDNELTSKRSSSSLDVTDLSQLVSIEDDIKAIIHLAAKTSIDNSFRSPHETYHTNLLGTLNLLEFARQKKVSKFINVSTYVYGKPHYLPINEKHPIDPHSPYNKSKLLAEQLCQFYSHDFNIDTVTLRPFSIYGFYPRPNSFIYCILEQILNKNGRVRLKGKLTKRDFLFVDDFSRLVENVLKKFPSGYNVYNVGYGKSYTLTEVSQILARLVNRKILIHYDNQTNPRDISEIVADRSKISSEFNWEPSTSIEKGLECTVKHYLRV